MNIRKGQIQTQAIVYILALIITALILIYGYGAIRDMIERERQASMMRLEKDLVSQVKALSNDYGSSKKVTFTAPSNYKSICCVDLNIDYADLQSKLQPYPIIDDSVESGAQKNCFLIPDGTNSIYVGDITVIDGFKCFDISQGRFTLRLEGMGSSVKLS